LQVLHLPKGRTKTKESLFGILKGRVSLEDWRKMHEEDVRADEKELKLLLKQSKGKSLVIPSKDNH